MMPIASLPPQLPNVVRQVGGALSSLPFDGVGLFLALLGSELDALQPQLGGTVADTSLLSHSGTTEVRVDRDKAVDSACEPISSAPEQLLGWIAWCVALQPVARVISPQKPAPSSSEPHHCTLPPWALQLQRQLEELVQGVRVMVEQSPTAPAAVTFRFCPIDAISTGDGQLSNTQAATQELGASSVQHVDAAPHPPSPSNPPVHLVRQQKAEGATPIELSSSDASGKQDFSSGESHDAASLQHVLRASSKLPTSAAAQLPTEHEVTAQNGLSAVLRATVAVLQTASGAAARLVLYPESLGTVVVRVVTQASGTTIHIAVSSSEGYNLVQQSLEALRAELHQAGVVADAVVVRLREESVPRSVVQHYVAPALPLVEAVDHHLPERRRQGRRQFEHRQAKTHSSPVFDHFA